MKHVIYTVKVKGLEVNQWFHNKMQMLKNNRGSGIIEYIALAAVVIAFCAAAATKGQKLVLQSRVS